MAQAASWHAGIDENGLGPRLGPLVVTGVLAHAADPQAAALASGPVERAGIDRLGDSKRLVGFGHSSLGEAWARALARRHGLDPRSPSDLFAAISLEPVQSLAKRCPTRLCWFDEGERFESPDAAVEAAAEALGSLESRGIRLELPRVAMLCVERLNDARSRGLTRQDADLSAMERLFVDLRERAGGSLSAICGKVGGRNAYRDRLALLPPARVAPLEEGAARSVYRVEGTSTLAFVRDAEDAHMLVALASLVGKWVRDLWMTRIVRRLQAADASLPPASGYYDPATERLVRESEAARASLAVPAHCFERR